MLELREDPLILYHAVGRLRKVDREDRFIHLDLNVPCSFMKELDRILATLLLLLF